MGMFRSALRGVVAAILVYSTAGCALFRPPVPDSIPVYSARAESGVLRAGAAAVDVTPEGSVLLAGYGVRRKSTGVHDPLYARALVLERDGFLLALVSVDVIGLHHSDILKIQERFEGIDPRHVIVASTHNHNGPDTIGIWGVPPFISGVDDDALERVHDGVVTALHQALAELRSAELASGSVIVDPKGLLENQNRAGVVDREVVVWHVREIGAGATIATVVELGCHPEVLERWNTEITADFPHWTVTSLEEHLGGVGIYVSGALGALVGPDVARSEPPDPEQEWREAARVGERLAQHAIDVVGEMTRYESMPELELWHAPIYLRNENIGYDLIRWTGVLERRLYGSGYFRSEVNLWRVGTCRLASVPGEITPALGLRIKRNAADELTMIVGLANDEIGYLIPGSEYSLPIYLYERTLCPGPRAADRIVRRLKDLGLLADQR